MFGSPGRFVDADALLTGYLFDGLGVEVFPTVPSGEDWAETDPSFVVAGCSGGAGRDRLVLQRVDIVVEAFAPTRVGAAELANAAAGLVEAMPGVRSGVRVYSAGLTVPRWFPYEGPFYPRFVAVGWLSIRLAHT